MKEWVVLFFVGVVLTFMVVNSLHLKRDHNKFFGDVRGFMAQGGRNTAEQGFKLCERLNRLEAKAGILTTDCRGAYYGHHY